MRRKAKNCTNVEFGFMQNKIIRRNQKECSVESRKKVNVSDFKKKSPICFHIQFTADGDYSNFFKINLIVQYLDSFILLNIINIITVENIFNTINIIVQYEILFTTERRDWKRYLQFSFGNVQYF